MTFICTGILRCVQQHKRSVENAAECGGKLVDEAILVWKIKWFFLHTRIKYPKNIAKFRLQNYSKMHCHLCLIYVAQHITLKYSGRLTTHIYSITQQLRNILTISNVRQYIYKTARSNFLKGFKVLLLALVAYKTFYAWASEVFDILGRNNKL